MKTHTIITICLATLTATLLAATNIVNLPATISTEIVTNWTTTRVESPTSSEWKPGLNVITLEYRATGYHESGVILSNTVATIEWRGKQIPVVLESVQIGTTNRVIWR